MKGTGTAAANRYLGSFQKNMDYNELIQSLNSGRINANDVQNIINMQKSKEKLFEKYNIKEIKKLGGADKRCYVRIKDENYSDGYKKITATSEESLWENIKQYDAEIERKSNEPTFAFWFDNWKLRQQEGKRRSLNTIDKYRSDYNRVFKNTKIELRRIKEIDSEELEEFILARYKEKKVPQKAAKNINEMVQGMFKYAMIKKKVTINICNYVDWEMIVSQCDSGRKNDEWKSVFENDWELLNKAVEKKREKEPDNLIPYVALFTSMAGTRASEGVVLTWEDISGEEIKISKSEKVIRNFGAETTHCIGKTKTNKSRTVPKTEQISKLLEEIQEIHNRNGWNSSYIFYNPNGNEEWIRSQIVRDWLRNNGCKCMQAMRATLSTELKKDGISEVIVSSLLGHTVRVNQMNYSPDVISISEKRNALSKSKCMVN